MDPIIEAYIKSTFHPDLVDVIAEAFRIMTEFDLQDFDLEMIDLLMTEEMDQPQNIQDHFTTLLHSKLDIVVHAHLIRLSETTPLHEKVAFLEGLFAIQHQADYSAIGSLLENEFSPEDKFAEVLAHCSTLTATAIFTMIDRIDPAIIESLKQFIATKEGNEGKLTTPYTDTQREIIKNLRQFKTFLKGKTAMGVLLAESHVLLGQPLERYVPYADELLKSTNYEQVALDVYSLLLLTPEGHINPLFAYRKHTGLLLDTLEASSRVDVLLTGLVGAFEKFKDTTNIVRDGQ